MSLGQQQKGEYKVFLHIFLGQTAEVIQAMRWSEVCWTIK
jgi:hypothetical protein